MPSDKTDAVTPGSSETGSTTVLIVDDDRDIRDVLRMMCEVGGFAVVGEAATGVEAIPLALKHQPTVVILDYLMPDLDGEKTAPVLRAVAPGVRVVAFSAALNARPDWSDAFLNKARVTDIVPLLEGLIR
ncbi:MAG: response regulator [Actinomycetota bacterium]|nr:response regulator [Actinomycetota bacterium]